MSVELEVEMDSQPVEHEFLLNIVHSQEAKLVYQSFWVPKME
jgi:hypothetical protein